MARDLFHYNVREALEKKVGTSQTTRLGFQLMGVI
jgi:hypothetical protein